MLIGLGRVDSSSNLVGGLSRGKLAGPWKGGPLSFLADHYPRSSARAGGGGLPVGVLVDDLSVFVAREGGRSLLAKAGAKASTGCLLGGARALSGHPRRGEIASSSRCLRSFSFLCPTKPSGGAETATFSF